MPLHLEIFVSLSPLNIKYESQYQGQKGRGILNNKVNQHFSFFLFVVFLA